MYYHVCVSADMNVDCLDEKAVMTYIACLCDAVHHDSAAATDTVHRQEVKFIDRHHYTTSSLDHKQPLLL